MFILSKEFTFEAAHRLPEHDGKCARLHGHSWKMRVSVVANSLQVAGPKSGMAVDYADIKATVQPYVERYLDHYYLNESLQMANPTSEMIAAWLWSQLFAEFRARGVSLSRIEIFETCTSSCSYSG